MKKSYFGLLRRLLAPAPAAPAPRFDFDHLPVIRTGRVLSDRAKH